MLLGDDELAAALIAVRCYLEEDALPAEAEPPAAPNAWRAAAVLDGQGLTPGRNGAGATWATADRAGREWRWSSGIVGG
ncbi:MAG: hypothetical protein OHK0022_01520 [Roseiflexaceae bacterium]